jgi:hypothetical protein
MAEKNLVVARYKNGCVVKGTTDDFFPNRLSFHIQVHPGSTVVVKMADLKAVYFVKSLTGDAAHEKTRVVPPEGAAEGKKITVVFKDGEVLTGHTMSYSKDKQGFFVVPADKQGNNIRSYVLTDATKNVKLGPAAETLAKSAPKKPRPSKAA